MGLNGAIIASCVLGMGLSYYAYVVETSKEADANYQPACDISEHMSCSKAFMSEFGKGFGIVHRTLGKDSALHVSNGLIGMFFYSVFAALSFTSSVVASRIQLFMAVLSNFGSVYLAYVLYFILYDFCVICVTTYIVNLVNLILVILKLRKVPSSTQKKTTSKKKKN
ncbi:vitamin K epoxide reductase complex subunit 1 [Schistocerca nitens]|uniref:vitamin K epoxide reductase complex subunit 1 n=1 Tax=Schistocerca nitens TaxID=7011 RepID=UPI0021182049|nr:vitamin K epoxide reductase complex subunit 1 [Schistocerca nitens]